jgi:hypothetical protein
MNVKIKSIFLAGGKGRGLKVAEVWRLPFTSTSAKVQNIWFYTTTHPYAFMAQCLICLAWGNFTFILIVPKHKLHGSFSQMK